MSDGSSNMTEGLNPQQLEAVTAERTNMLIYAGAGSGKTRVLVSRIVYLLTVERIPPCSIMAATFTNKAANEMKTRIAAAVGKDIDVRELQIGTFHSICMGILRRYNRDAGLPPVFSVIDDTDQLALIRQIVKRESTEAVDKEFPKDTRNFINRCKEKGLRAANCFGDEIEKYRSDVKRQHMARIYRLYEEYCFNAGVVDFGEMILRVCELLENNVFVRSRFHSQISEILVDEFQDSNDIQLRLLACMKSDDCHLTVVGDDDQSIYSWRGANPRNLIEFAMRMPMVKVVKLEQNYRSTTHILNVANSLIAGCQENTKNLWTERTGGDRVGVYQALTPREEAEFVVNRILSLHSREKIPYRKFAILYRNNSLSLSFENALRTADIPYRVVAGHRFYDRREIRDAMAYIRLVANPKDDSSFARVVNIPQRGIGEKSISFLVSYAGDGGISLFEAAETAVRERLLKGKALSGLKNFVDTVNSLIEKVDGKDLVFSVNLILKDSGLLDYYMQEELKEKDVGKSRTGNLEELVNSCQNYSFLDEIDCTGIEALSAYTQDLTLQTDLDEIDDGQGKTSSDDRVNLLTIHSAKGLEFDTVFLVAFEDGIIPSSRALSSDREVQGSDGWNEELRLAYVAVTRAETRCYISFARNRSLYGKNFSSEPSQFFDLINKSDIKHVRKDEKLMNIFRSRLKQERGIFQDQYAGMKSAQEPDDYENAVPEVPYSAGKDSHGKNASEENPGMSRHGGDETAGAGKSGGTGSELLSSLVKLLSLEDGRVDSGELDFAVGDRVLHQKFGEGKILNIVNDAYTKVTVEFKNGSVKQLSLRFAGLKKLSDE